MTGYKLRLVSEFLVDYRYIKVLRILYDDATSKYRINKMNLDSSNSSRSETGRYQIPKMFTAAMEELSKDI